MSTMSSGRATWRVTEPMAKLPCKMRIVAKAAGIGDLAERLACTEQRPTMQKVRGVIQTKRIDVFAAGRAALSEELLHVTQRDPSLGCHLPRTEIGIGKAVADHAADTIKQL